MISSFGESFSLAIDHTRGSNTTAKNVTDDVCRASYSFCDRIPVAQPPSHPTATREVGKLLDLGLALGHQRFELVSLAERDDAGMVAAHAWAETRDGELEYPENKYPSAGVHVSIGRSSTTPVRTQSRPRPCSHSDSRSRGVWNENISREVEWLRERVDNLSRELVVARRDSGRLAKQLKHEEEIGREQRRRADEAVREATALREEVERLKEARTASGCASRAALSDAHDRSVRMAERRRRQQAESLMQAYKGLYEDQLQTQQAAAESYRTLTRGYSRLSADNKALRKETAAAAAAPAPAAAVTVPTDTNTRATPQTQTTQKARDPGMNTVGEVAVRRPGATNFVQSLNEAGDGGAGAQHAATASESAAAVATAAAAVVAAAGSLAVAASFNDDDGNRYTEQHSQSRGDGAEREKGPGCVGKSRTSPTDSASTVETLACSPFGDEEWVMASAVGPCKRHLADGNEAARGRGRLAPSSTVGGTVREQDVSAGDVPIARGSGDPGEICTIAEAYAFPRTGGPLALPRQPPQNHNDDGECSADQSPREKPRWVAVPPTDHAPRCRGRNVGPGRTVASSTSWAEAVDVPKRSNSPTPPGRGRWGACGGGGRGWRTEELGEDGCTRIEPSRTRPHSI